VKRGDRVALYLPLIPELAIAMLACARIGAVHSVVFGGFSAESLRDRINDAQAVLLVTADGGYRRGQIVPLKLPPLTRGQLTRLSPALQRQHPCLCLLLFMLFPYSLERVIYGAPGAGAAAHESIHQFRSQALGGLFPPHKQV
jgi:hypothetical protein